MRHWVSVILFTVFLAFFGCGPERQPRDSHQVKPAETLPSRPPTAARSLKTPRYKVLEDETHLDIKRSVDILLETDVSAEAVRLIALEVKSSNPNEFKRTFIAYYLPGMIVDSGAWATTHFNPDLQVQILGVRNGTFVRPPPRPDLVLEDWNFQIESGYGIVSGEITNNTLHPIAKLTAVATFHAEGGAFIKTSEALISFNPLAPGQTSPFEITAPMTSKAKSSRLSFKELLGGKIEAVLRLEFDRATAEYNEKRKAEAEAWFGRSETPSQNESTTDSRVQWSNVSYDTTISHLQDKKWQEIDNKTQTVKWELTETGRTETYVQLVNADRNQIWRLFSDRMEFVNGGSWKWLSKGHWKKAN
jgi:hypothetical protein